MSPFQRLASAFEALWSAIDPDEPVFCDCRQAFTCPDCALLAATPDEPAWPQPAVLPSTPAA